VKILETERLVLRQMNVDDDKFIFDLVNEPAFIQNIGDKGVRTLEDARDYILTGPVASYAKFGFGLYLVELAETGAPIGICGLLKRDSLEDVDIGFAFLEKFWGKGFAHESAAAVMEYGRSVLGIERIVAITSPDNEGSIRVLSKLGLRFEKMIRMPGSDDDTRLFRAARLTARNISSETKMQALKTKRLILRDWKAADREPFAQINADPRVMEYLGEPLSREQSDGVVDRIEAHFRTRGLGLCAAELAETGEFIGFIGLAVPTFEAAFTPCVEIGWRLAAEYWGQGLAIEGAREMARFAFEELKLLELVSMTAVENERSRRVMEKLGMTRDPAEDFDHPKLPAGYPLRRHVLYRLSGEKWRNSVIK
jgi:RimJ/RimL family protein N-acetyltransferase